MRPDRSASRQSVSTLIGWTIALGVWVLALYLVPGAPRALLEATQLAALYALGRS